MMKIEKITLEIKEIALKTAFVTALRRVESVAFVRVKVLCDNGVYAYGEAPATLAITGEDLKSISSAIEQEKKGFYLFDPSEAITKLHTLTIGSSAKAALDIAFVSLLAKQNNQELYQYLGAQEWVEIATDITISLNPLEIMLEDAQKAISDGMDILKIKLGEDISHAIEVTKQLSKKFPNATLLIDANQAWRVQESLDYIKSIETIAGMRVALIEQPVKADDLKGLYTITQATTIPIVADEAAFDLDDVKKIISNRCATMINVKLMKCGGLSKAIEILEYAREKGIKCMLGSMLEGPISINAAQELAVAYRDVISYVDLDSPYLYKKE
jgi:o-succinylbenzoate synthase